MAGKVFLSKVRIKRTGFNSIRFKDVTSIHENDSNQPYSTQDALNPFNYC
ncbi:Uncharacterized protein dnl_20970 [Desulfonema limicola]|uniref:Uncharacterized protein n=1 Tax=Desulfonema limicola TaxID=45656 RepID=A0A975GG19_9BACT|nr:Uncharacterized protein dnl_20970 [Desulfonema limicola]